MKTGYNPTYVKDVPLAKNEKIDGRALVYMPKNELEQMILAKPTSITGHALTLEIPAGEIMKGVSVKTLDNIYLDGVDFATRLENAEKYKLIVKPKITSFEHEYNALKNLGFAITPQVKVNAEILIVNARNEVVDRKYYESGNIDGDTYMLNLQPTEAISKILHQTLQKFVIKAINEIYYKDKPMIEFGNQ